MRERELSKALALTLVLLFLICPYARANDGARAVVQRIAPIYPELAKQMHLGGAVVLILSVEPDGTVSDVKALSGHPLLLQSAIDAVKRWKFVPASQASQTTISVNFDTR